MNTQQLDRQYVAHTYNRFPLEIAGGKGSTVYGADGRSRFGEPIRESAVVAGLCSVDGVLAVKRLRMNIDRPDCKKTSAGISIPPHAIACCGKVELISSGN